MKTADLYCNDKACPECHEEPVLLRCLLCGVRGMVTDCGHLDMPRPLSTSCGSDWPLIVCHHCERRQEHVVHLVQTIMPSNANDLELTRYRKAVNTVLRIGTRESGRAQLTEHQAVAYVWNGGRWEDGIKAVADHERKQRGA